MHQFNIYDFSVSFLNYDSNLILSFVIFDNFLSEWYQHLLKKWNEILKELFIMLMIRLDK